jgi:hypothetical protein
VPQPHRGGGTGTALLRLLVSLPAFPSNFIQTPPQADKLRHTSRKQPNRHERADGAQRRRRRRQGSNDECGRYCSTYDECWGLQPALICCESIGAFEGGQAAAATHTQPEHSRTRHAASTPVHARTAMDALSPLTSFVSATDAAAIYGKETACVPRGGLPRCHEPAGGVHQDAAVLRERQRDGAQPPH